MESTNLIHDPRQKERIAELTQQLADLMATNGIAEDQMPMDEGIKGELPDKAIR